MSSRATNGRPATRAASPGITGESASAVKGSSRTPRSSTASGRSRARRSCSGVVPSRPMARPSAKAAAPARSPRCKWDQRIGSSSRFSER